MSEIILLIFERNHLFVSSKSQAKKSKQMKKYINHLIIINRQLQFINNTSALADITLTSFTIFFAFKILTKMKNLFGFPLYAVCCILSICMPVNLVSSGVGLKGNWPTVQCTI